MIFWLLGWVWPILWLLSTWEDYKPTISWNSLKMRKICLKSGFFFNPSGLAFVQALIYAIHKLVEYCQKRTVAHSILPVNTVATPEALPQPTPHMALMLNTVKYNPDVLNWQVAFATIFMLPLLFFGYFVICPIPLCGSFCVLFLCSFTILYI